jgi:DNA-binding transcriptional regulator GbsR (MarR family)
MISLTPVMMKIILHWGEMGSSWGINRTVAQIYALLFLSPDPLTAEEICECLNLARSTVSTGLHELQTWGVIKVVHVLGDRRDHFTSMSDIWEIFRVILDERKRREIDPTLSFLRDRVDELHNESTENPFVEERVQEMLDFFELVTSVYEQVESIPTENLKEIFKMGTGFGRVVSQVVRK